MRKIKILGSGCRNCKTALVNVKKAAEELGVEVEIVKVEDIMEIAAYGVMALPAVVLDEKVVFAGGIPDAETIKSWFEE